MAYGPFIEIEYLLVLKLWIDCTKFRSDTFRNDMVFEVLDKKIFCLAFLSTWYINIATFKVFNLYTFKTLFHRNNCFVCSNFPLLQIMRIAYFC